MGFGILFLGYAITFILSLNPYGVYMRLVGSVLVLVATKKLSAYNGSFKYPSYAAIFLICSSAFASVTFTFDLLYRNMLLAADPIPEITDTILVYVNAFGVLVFNILLILAIRRIAKETEADKIYDSCITNIFFVAVYFLLYALNFVLPSGIKESYVKYMSMPIFILNIVWIFMSAILIFRCYARICDINDIDMTPKSSGLDFFKKRPR